MLLGQTMERLEADHASAVAVVGEIEALLSAEDAVLDRACKEGSRVASHLLGATRRHTESLLVDLRNFLVELERSLPVEVAEVRETVTVRRALPHWLQHVLEDWLVDRLATWRADVMADLADAQISEADAAKAELLIPALHPPPLRGDPAWMRRLATTVAMGGGATLLLLGQWIAGLVTLSGALAFSSLGDPSREARHRQVMVQSAIDGLRQLGRSADQTLREQLVQLEQELKNLGEHRRLEVASERTGLRQRLQLRHTEQSRIAERAEALRDNFQLRVEAL
jgi:hypothetical protein